MVNAQMCHNYVMMQTQLLINYFWFYPLNLLISYHLSHKQWFCFTKWIHPLLEIPAGLHLLTCPLGLLCHSCAEHNSQIRKIPFFTKLLKINIWGASLLTFLPYLKPGLVLTRTLGRTALRVRLPLGPGLPLSLVGQVRAAADQPQPVQRGGSDGVGQGASGFFSSSFSFNNVF